MDDREMWTIDRIRALGATTDLVTAGEILGMGRSTAYVLARQGRFPVPVLRPGTKYIVPVQALLRALHADHDSHDASSSDRPEAALDPTPDPRVHATATQPADCTNVNLTAGNDDEQPTDGSLGNPHGC